MGVKDWYFVDTQGKVQGPFSSMDMQTWMEAGYFTSDLLITDKDPKVKSSFRKLGERFPKLEQAFRVDQVETKSDDDDGASAGRWYFLDREAKVQGPFSTEKMRLWHEHGYFEKTLKIMDGNASNPQWRQLQTHFPVLKDAFLVGRTSALITLQLERLAFPEWLPVPPRFKGIKKTYPSEKKGGKRAVRITDLHGKNVDSFIRSPRPLA